MAKLEYFQYEQATCRLVIWDEANATLSSLYSNKRNQGHGKAVLRLVCDYADERGLTLLLEVQRFGGDHLCPDNYGLMSLYSKFGFVSCGERRMLRSPSREIHTS